MVHLSPYANGRICARDVFLSACKSVFRAVTTIHTGRVYVLMIQTAILLVQILILSAEYGLGLASSVQLDGNVLEKVRPLGPAGPRLQKRGRPPGDCYVHQ